MSESFQAECPEHGGTSSVPPIHPPGTIGPMWRWMECEDYYSPTFKMFKTPKQLMGPKEWKRYRKGVA